MIGRILYERKFGLFERKKKGWLYRNPGQDIPVFYVLERPCHLVWWILSVNDQKLLEDCEAMSLFICNSTLLKGSDYRLKGISFSNKINISCDLGIIEDKKPNVMQCPAHTDLHKEIYRELRQNCGVGVNKVLEDSQNVFYVLMGKCSIEISFESMIPFRRIAERYIACMYRMVL